MSRCWHQTVCLIALGLSVYTVFVEHKMETQKDYKPSCDFDSLEIFGHESKCSIAFASDYGKGLFGWFKTHFKKYKHLIFIF